MIPSTTSSGAQQYLSPEYLAPSTMDAKKSPLALLAQACNQIGATDLSINKTLSTSDSKQRSKQNGQRDKYSPGMISVTRNISESSKDYDSKAVSPFREVSRRSSGSNLESPPVSRNSTLTPTLSSSVLPLRKPTSSPSRKKNVALKVPKPPTPTSISERYSHMLESNTVGNTSPYGIPTSHYDSPSSALFGIPPMQTQLPILNPGTLMNPYPMYNFQKPSMGSSSNEPLMTLYRDPFCVGCRLGSHPPHPIPVSGGETCGPNCNQCEKHTAAIAAAVSNLNNQFAVSALLAHALPFVCNWVVGEAQCGRRFSTSEDLLQHLSSHMNVVVTTPTATMTRSTQPSPHPPPLLPIHSPSHSLLSPVQTQHRAYPTPPLSPLGSRFHPYTKPQGNSTQTPNHSMPAYLPYPPYLYYPSNPSIHQ